MGNNAKTKNTLLSSIIACITIEIAPGSLFLPLINMKLAT